MSTKNEKTSEVKQVFSIGSKLIQTRSKVEKHLQERIDLKRVERERERERESIRKKPHRIATNSLYYLLKGKVHFSFRRKHVGFAARNMKQQYRRDI